MLKLGLLIAAVVLFVIAAIPMTGPYHGTLVAAGLACLAASELPI
jgi:hypothetical protein